MSAVDAMEVSQASHTLCCTTTTNAAGDNRVVEIPLNVGRRGCVNGCRRHHPVDESATAKMGLTEAAGAKSENITRGK